MKKMAIKTAEAAGTAAKLERARQLLEGCTPKVEGSPKPARRALQEVARGAVARVEPRPE